MNSIICRLIRPFSKLFILLIPISLLGTSLGADPQKPLKVFILAGQSNMQGHAQLRTFEHIGLDPKTAPLLQMMQSDKGTPRISDQVWISYLSANLEKKGQLTAGFGANENKIGPEFTFGLTMEQELDEPILIIKTAWGGKSLHTDFRPPSAGPYEFTDQQLQQMAKRGDDLEKRKAEKIEATGHYYRLMLTHVRKVLADISEVYPDYDTKLGYELAGFVWFQGWNDMVDSRVYPERSKAGGYDAYSKAMAHFIRDIRKDLSAPRLPFVIGVLGVGGPIGDYPPDEQRHKTNHKNFRSAMEAPAKLPEFKDNVIAVRTENYWDQELKALTARDEQLKRKSRTLQKERKLSGKEAQAQLEEFRTKEFSEKEREILNKGISNQAYHYLGSAKIIGQIGRGFAEAIIRLSPSSGKKHTSRIWTQTGTGRQLTGKLERVEGKGDETTITISHEGKLIPIPLKMLTDDDKRYVADWRAKNLATETNATSSASGAHSEPMKMAEIPEGIPNFVKGGVIPKKAVHDWNLGPTGARGWIYSNKLETSEARQIVITKVYKDSPAEGVLKKGDVILGVENQPFHYDPRTELGKAISAAETRDGRLSLIRWREGEITTSNISLAAIGGYSETAPFDCPKSARIFQQGCEALADQIKKNPKQGNPITRSLNALALLASGEKKYLPIVRDQIEELSQFSDPKRQSLHSWFYGPITMLVAEYTLATGDNEYLKELERLTMEIVRGQSEVGSWGHRFVQKNGILSGYGMMNAPGIPLTISLTLSRAAGVSNPELDEAIEKSTRLLRFYVGKGSIPYGDHRPWTQTHDDNGKNGAAAVLFNLLGDAEAAEYFSHMSIASHGAEREMGHTGNFFNLLWALPSVALSGPEASGAWIKEYGWHYDLARRWDGTWLHQGPPQDKYDSYKLWNSTGAYLLAYAQPLRKIFLTGKKQGVIPQVDESTAKGLIADGRDWSPRFKGRPYADRDEKILLEGLRSWSPTVRERSAMALGQREDAPVRALIAMLREDDLYTRIGACQALATLKARGAPAVRELRNTLESEDLWLRIEAAEALAAIGNEAMSAVPELLRMLAHHDAVNDPRGMQQRYLCFALFDRRNGLLKGSLDGVDRDALYEAVKAGLTNEDGRARGTLATIYRNLSYDEIEPLLPAIIKAVATPAPSGIMFADGIRLNGLELLARNKHKEGLDYFFEVMGVDRWGQKSRVLSCLKTLQIYGGAAKPLLPQLVALEKKYQASRKPPEPQLKLLQQTIAKIKEDKSPPALRSLEKTN